MKQLLLYLAIAFQVISVAWVAISREWIVISGEPVLLQTAPIDPRDLFRGDYVSLDYPFNNIQPKLFDHRLTEHKLNKGDKVYLSLQLDQNRVATASGLHAGQPDNGLFLKGRVQYRWTAPSPLRVNFGIEKYFVQQGKGLAIEKTRGLHDPQRERFQRPMLMQARLHSDGSAVLTGFEWGKLGYKTDIVATGDLHGDDTTSSAIVRFTLKNLSEHNLSLPLKPGNCSFTLKPSDFDFDSRGLLQSGRHDCDKAMIETVALKPQQTHSIEFDLNNPAWRFANGKKTDQPLGRVPWNWRMRIHYTGEPIIGLKAAIVSRSFHGRGQVD